MTTITLAQSPTQKIPEKFADLQAFALYLADQDLFTPTVQTSVEQSWYNSGKLDTDETKHDTVNSQLYR